MEDKLILLKSYNQKDHLVGLYNRIALSQITPTKISPIYSEIWEDENWKNNHDIPYVPITHLLDAYYCLPERIDMGYTFLWKAFNGVYTECAIKTVHTKSTMLGITLTTSEKNKLSDSIKIKNIIDEINSIISVSFEYDGQNYTIRKLIDDFIQLIPIKLIKFISNYLLKGYVIEQKGFETKYLTSQYTSFRKNLPTIFDEIIATYGQAYLDVCIPELNRNATSVDMNVIYENKTKSKKIILSLSEKLKTLLIDKRVTISDKNNANPRLIEIEDDIQYLKFIIFGFLYAIRNRTVHGNIASRFNSEYANYQTLISTEYTFLLGHLFLSLALFVNGQLNATDLCNNIKNTKMFSELHKDEVLDNDDE